MGTPIGQPLQGHTDSEMAIIFSPDGTQFALCTPDHPVQLWDAHTGTPIGEHSDGQNSWVDKPPVHQGWLLASPSVWLGDGISATSYYVSQKTLAVGYDDGKVVILQFPQLS
jgi:WD40 repeat protein